GTFTRMRAGGILAQNVHVSVEPEPFAIRVARNSPSAVAARELGIVILEALTIEVRAQPRRPWSAQGDWYVDRCTAASEVSSVSFHITSLCCRGRMHDMHDANERRRSVCHRRRPTQYLDALNVLEAERGDLWIERSS